MHITHVKTNAKVGADTEIGEKTLIVGRNGSGKSTIINAVELALTSRVSDIAGRTDVAREADVMQLAPPATPLFAEISFDDGKHASYIVEGSTAKAKKAAVSRPDYVGHDEVLPIRTLKEAVLGSPQTARKYLLSKVAGAVTREDVAELMDPSVRESWTKAVALVPESVPAPDALVTVMERAASSQREASSTAKTQREVAKSVGGGRAAPPSRQELDAAKKEQDAARAAWQVATASQGSADRKAKLEAALDVEAKKAEAALTEAAMLAAKVANLPEIAPPHAVFPHVCEVLKTSMDEGACLACGNEDTTQMPEALKAVESLLKDYQKASAERTKLMTEAKSAQFKADALIESVERLEAQLGESSAPADAGLSVEEAKTALDAAEKRLMDLKVVADAWASAKKAEAAATEAEAQAEGWKSLKAACEEAVAVVLHQALTAFIAKVQANLPEGDTFDLRLKDGDREVVQFGLVRDGHLHTALSGAEWARVMAAMAEACVPEGRFAVLVPEERAFDPETLGEVLAAFGATKHQVIIASPVKPKKTPKGWTVITRGVA
jgi:energy-coupling factor transporter ATP-binding protein EcfA2